MVFWQAKGNNKLSTVCRVNNTQWRTVQKENRVWNDVTINLIAQKSSCMKLLGS